MADLFYNGCMKRNQRGQFIKGTNGWMFEGFGVWKDSKGYPSIWLDGRSVRLHVLIWERANGSKPRGFKVHHKDWDVGNYSLENLDLFSNSDHLKVHSGWLQDGDGIWTHKPCKRCNKVKPLEEFYPRKGYTPSALCKPCHNEAMKVRQSTTEAKSKLRLYKQRWAQVRGNRLRRERYAKKRDADL